MDQFRPAELVAIATVFKDKAIDAAKDSIPDGSTSPIDVTVRVTGSIQKGFGTPEVVSNKPAEIDLLQPKAVYALLRRLGIGPLRLRDALDRLPLPDAMPEDSKLANVFTEIATSKAKKLPPKPTSTKGKRGACTTSLTATRV